MAGSNRSILTEIYLCHACSDHESEGGNGPDRALGGGGVAALEAGAGSLSALLLAVTADGATYVWDMDDARSPALLLRASLAPLLASNDLRLSQAMLTPGSGVETDGVAESAAGGGSSVSVVVLLSDGNAYSYDSRAQVWLRVADRAFQLSDFHSSIIGAAATAPEHGATALATVREAAAAAAAAGSGGGGAAAAGRVRALLAAQQPDSAGGHCTTGRQSLAHLEALLSTVCMLDRGSLHAASVSHASTGAGSAAVQAEYRYRRCQSSEPSSEMADAMRGGGGGSHAP
jgi:hypothetical protein